MANGFIFEGKEIENPHMDVDLDECNRGCDDGISHIPSGSTKEQFIMKEEKYQLDANTESELNSHSQDVFMQVDNHVTGSLGSDSELGKIGSSSQSPTLGLNCTLPEFATEVFYFLLSEHYFLLRYIGVLVLFK